MVSTKALNLIESKPGAYVVWLDTKGHPGDLRGKLFAGMAHMSPCRRLDERLDRHSDTDRRHLRVGRGVFLATAPAA